jgi:hypothetical protein
MHHFEAAVGGDKALAGCCYGRRPRPDQGLIHRPTKTEVTAVVTCRVARISAAVARACIQLGGVCRERNRIKRGTPFYDPEPGVILGIPKSVVE